MARRNEKRKPLQQQDVNVQYHLRPRANRLAREKSRQQADKRLEGKEGRGCVACPPEASETFECIDDHFEYVEKLGKGSYGTVIAATDRRTKNKVAIKAICETSGSQTASLQVGACLSITMSLHVHHSLPSPPDKVLMGLLLSQLLREILCLRHFCGHENIIQLQVNQSKTLHCVTECLSVCFPLPNVERGLQECLSCHGDHGH